MKRFEQPRPRRLSFFNVALAHVLVLLQVLTPCTQAGDILRMGAGSAGGAAVPGSTPTADSSAVNTAAATAQARTNAQDMLARNAMAMQAVTAMQAAAHAAATANNAGANPNFPGQTLPDVPNGLGAGGLELSGTPIIGALTPQQSMENAETIVKIQQTQQQALLEWKTFNVGRDTTVRFDQSAGGESAGNWIAFNRVTDLSANPTQILGTIEAQGQVYIINQNGIIFGGGSVVNTHALVASALPINDNLVTRGLLNNPDSQFLFSANAQAAGSKGPTPAYTPPALPSTGRIGNVTVQAGARITAPTSSANVGGRVALIGPNVTNNGTITTPDGQTILAAGMEVGFDAHSADDPSLRGLDVFVGSVGTYGGTATNNGVIDAPRGSVLITGKEVNQNGFISSTTSAALNGRVDLLANYNAIANTNYDSTNANFSSPFVYRSAVSTGTVRTGDGSVIQVMPEYDSSLKVVGTELALKSQVNMQGLAIYLGSDSVVLAPNADVALSAGIWDLVLRQGFTDLDFVQAGGQVYMDQRAVIDVAGSTAVSSLISDYIISVDLRAAELADSALQRNGSLRGQTIVVDLREHGVREDGTEWVGTPLADLTGYLGIIERNVGQLTVAGGHVSITAGDSVVIQNNAVVNVSGGYKDYAAGYVATTRLIHEGNIIDIADARADILYEGIYTPTSSVTDPKWSTTTSTTALFADGGHMESAYSAGANGGSLSISAPAMALDGRLVGATITGPQQLESAPQQSILTLKFQAQVASRAPLDLPSYYPTPPDIVFSNSPAGLATVNAFSVDGSGAPVSLGQGRRDSVVLSPTLLGGQGFGSLSVDNSDGDISIAAGVSLVAPGTGSISLRGANIDVEGSILAPGGKIDLVAYNVSPYANALLRAQLAGGGVLPPVDPNRGKITLGANAVLSTAGLVINDRGDAPVPLSIAHQTRITLADGSTSYASTMSGGSISLTGYTVALATGGLLDVSGGLLATNDGITFSNAGAISIVAGHDPLVESLLGGQLVLGAAMRGFSGASGGSLSLQATTIQVGSGGTSSPDTLLLLPEFFNQGGFSHFNLTGIGSSTAPAVYIAPGTVIRPLVQKLQAVADIQGQTSSIVVSTLLQPEGYRDAATLQFEALGMKDVVDKSIVARGDIVMGQGARIETDALGSVAFLGQTVEVLGEIYTPGGSITIQGASRFPQNVEPTVALTTVHLGAGSRLSTAGKVVLLQDPYGLRTGHVYGGGSILVGGNIIADAGAVLDVSGTTGILDLQPRESGITNVYTDQFVMASLFPGTGVTRPIQAAQGVATQVDSNGGSITFKGGDFVYSQATLHGEAGGSTAQGGVLTVSSDRFRLVNEHKNDKDITLLVAQDITAFAQPVFTPGQSVIGKALVNGAGGAITAEGYFGVNSFRDGGFDSLVLAGNVQFVGAVDVNAAGYLKVADGGVLAANDLVRLSASYVALGQPLINPIRDEELLNPFIIHATEGETDVPSYFSPTYGGGRLEVTADLIETGFLSLQNIGQASLTARQDFRGNGFLDIAGDLTITAGQVYPVTASSFTITAYNYTAGGVARNGSVTFASTGTTPALPLSGGGRLNIYAATINQGGILRAPLGTINLGWDGTGTAPKGLVTNVSVPVTQQVTLQSGGSTSVSAIDPLTGQGVRIPYGIIKDGTNWIDPTGFDITTIGAPDKAIHISGANVTTQAGSTIDIRGGGELYGYRWVEGNGGTNDILNTNGSYAILPSYASFFAPLGAYASTGINLANLGGDKGYTSSTLNVGDRIFLKAADGVAEGVYTLLPARYALLPGAMLVTPDSGVVTASQVKPGGAILTSGYLFNSLNANATSRIFQQFEVAPLSVVKARADYVDYTANVFIPAAQQRLGLSTTRTSADAGYTLLSSLQTMQLSGGLNAEGFGSGRGGRVDISSPLDIIVAAPGAPAQAGKLVLNSTLLSGWHAESLFIGGVRTFGADSTTTVVRTGNLTLDNAGAPLSGKEIILAATGTLTIASNAQIIQSGVQTLADSISVTGNGALVRVSGVSTAQTSRTGTTVSALPQIIIGADAQISGPSIMLDSSNATTLSPSAVLTAQAVSVNSGRLSILLTDPGALQANAGLVLSGTVLSSLQAASSLSLLSYSSIDFYGKGTFAAAGALALHAGEIRGFNNAGDTVHLTATSLLLDNSSSSTVPGAVAGLSGTLEFKASTITIGQNALAVDQFSTVILEAGSGLRMSGTGSFRAQGALSAITPFVSASSSATQALMAGGVLNLIRPATALAPTSLGLGGQVSFEGSSVTVGTDILLPSGLISLRALTGDLTVNGLLYAGGTTQTYFDTVRYTNAGQVTLTSTQGNVTVGSSGVVNVAAAAGGGDAGLLVINASQGVLTLGGSLLGQAGAGGKTASVELDLKTISSFSTLNTLLNNGSFTNGREIRVRSGDVAVDGTVNARRFLLGADLGSITVNGAIDASGATGGSIQLVANGSVTLTSGSMLTVKGQKFDDAGKGGSISLEAGAQYNGVVGAGYVDIQTGSTLDMSVVSKVAVASGSTRESSFYGQYSGTLHIRAPQIASADLIQVKAINGTLIDPSSIIIEGYKLYDRSQANVIIQAGTQAVSGVTFRTSDFLADANTFFGTANGNANYNAMFSRLVSGNSGIMALEGQLASTGGVVVIAPGIEISNRGGDITLGSTTSSGYLNDWDLNSFHIGPKGAAGILTIRAAGNLVLYNTISDGFQVATSGTIAAAERMWMAPLAALSTLRPVNAQSWSYRFTAGADIKAANFREVVPLTSLGASSGSLLIGKNAQDAIGGNTGDGSTAITRLAINPTGGTATNLSNFFQVIRTGTGDIDINAGRDVQLLNQFATIYSAGAQVASTTTVFSANDFVTPNITLANGPDQVGTLGAVQQLYAAQYSRAGGNVSVQAGNDIAHYTKDSTGTVLLADSQRQLPTNWLMRRGYVNADGIYGSMSLTSPGRTALSDSSASTTWWVNFSNFFDGIAALGGGNVTLTAGRDVLNVSAHSVTNARAASGAATAANLLELGGGDVTVTTGRNIDGGVYYVERGIGTLQAQGVITTNATRAPGIGRLSGGTPSEEELMTSALYKDTWLPTTLFAGKTSFNVSARGDVLLGPVVNTMLMPQGLTNRHWYKTYFSTYDSNSAVNVVSLSGDVTIRTQATLSTSPTPDSLLGIWMKKELLFTDGSAAYFQPWLRLAENDVDAFSTLTTLMPGTLRVVAHSGSINLVGNINLSPSPTGTLELLAAKSFNGLVPTGVTSGLIDGRKVVAWASSVINLSDANPASVPAFQAPFSYYGILRQDTSLTTATLNNAMRQTNAILFNALSSIFVETGSTTGVNASIQSKQALHAQSLLHANDRSSMLIYAGTGDISGLTLFSSKQAKILAGQDITDIGLYIQNVRASDVSVVSSGRDIVAYNANSKLRSAANQTGNLLVRGEGPKSGDIQINGPGTLQVLAGRDINLGTGSNNADGTGVGITSIGNGRNPYLPFAGADVVIAAGMGGAAAGLGGSNGQFGGFITALLKEILDPPAGQARPGIFDTRRYLSELAEMLQKNGLGGLPGSVLVYDPAGPAVEVGSSANLLLPAFNISVDGVLNGQTAQQGTLANSVNLDDPSLTAEQRNQLGLALYFLALRDAGRDRNNPDSPDVNTYRAGYEAIQALFPVADLRDSNGNVITKGIDLLKDADARPLAGYAFSGNIETQGRDIRTKSGGNISILTPGGGLQLAATLIGETLAPPGIITESGGSISIFADQDVSIGIARIFTLRGGDINIWSTVGDIAAGSSSKTVQSAPPTRVLIDPQSANVATDLAGLATGGGIGVLATVAGVAPGNVDLIAPIGAVDAGDAGIRATGNLNIAAARVINANNIVTGGTASGTPSASAVASPSLGSVTGANNAVGANNNATAQAAEQAKSQQGSTQEEPSIITVEIIGYGGGAGDDEERKRNQPGE